MKNTDPTVKNTNRVMTNTRLAKKNHFRSTLNVACLLDRFRHQTHSARTRRFCLVLRIGYSAWQNSRYNIGQVYRS